MRDGAEQAIAIHIETGQRNTRKIGRGLNEVGVL